MKRLQLPYGVQDYFPDECYNKQLAEDKICGVFYSAGYEKVETGALEYFDLFDGILEKNEIRKMFKLTDVDGSLLVLRPDTTLQICRMAASRQQDDNVQRLYYSEKSYEFITSEAAARTREFSQVGLELLGNSGIEGDIEIITLAIEALKAAGVKDFLIEIGNLNFFDGLMSECGITERDVLLLRALINKKDLLGIEKFANERSLRGDFKEKLTALPSLFGGEEVLKKAQKLCSNPDCLSAIKNLELIISSLKAIGYEKYIALDLGMLQGSYYSGTIIRGIVKNLGVPVLDGGRYDGLCARFGAPMQAVGFAIGIKRLLMALEEQNSLKKTKPCDIAYICKDKLNEEQHKLILKLKSKGKRLVKVFSSSRDFLIEYCNKNSIPKAYLFSGDVTEETIIK